MSYLLDTNIISLFDPRRQSLHADVIGWLRAHDAELHVSIISVFEVELGIRKLLREGSGARATELSTMRDEIVTSLGSRLLPIGVDVALAAARLSSDARPAVIETRDLFIAATAAVHGLTLLTRNTRHFQPAGVACIDPVASLPS